MIDSAVWYLQLERFQPEQILEHQLSKTAAQAAPASASTFLDALAAATPTPGGGSAAAHAGAMGAALVAMVAHLSIGRKKYAAVEAQMNEILDQAERLRRELSAAVEEDASAFNDVLIAFKLPHESPEQKAQRQAAIEQASLRAAQVPLAVAQKAVTVMALAERSASLGNLNAISDAASAAALALAALTSAGYNVRINLNGLSNKAAGETLLIQLQVLEARARKLDEEVRNGFIKRTGISIP